MLKNSFLVISLLLPLTALSATAQAGWPEAQTAAARSNPQHYWPSEARPAVAELAPCRADRVTRSHPA